MNNELIERIELLLSFYSRGAIASTLQDCIAALAQQQREAESVGEWKPARYGDYPEIVWNPTYVAKIGDKFYLNPPTPAAQPQVPDGYQMVREPKPNQNGQSFADRLAYWRTERPSEWLMDEFIRDAQILEAKLAAKEEGK